tara:strand:+ start:3572 stop:4177 length:606 start_codon:yes stop_codon:yes gene_type:complete
MKNIIQNYYIIIEQFKTILKEHTLNNNQIYIIGLHMLEHIFKFCTIYNIPQLDTCKKAIYYYIEFILQLNEDIKLSTLKRNRVCIFIYNKLFTSPPEIKSTIHLIEINNILQILNFHYTHIKHIEYLIHPLSKLSKSKIIQYNQSLPYLLYYIDNKSLFIKQHVHYIKLLENTEHKFLKKINNNLFKIDNTIIKLKLEHFI